MTGVMVGGEVVAAVEVQDFGIMDITAERLEVLIKVVKQAPISWGRPIR